MKYTECRFPIIPNNFQNKLVQMDKAFCQGRFKRRDISSPLLAKPPESKFAGRSFKIVQVVRSYPPSIARRKITKKNIQINLIHKMWTFLRVNIENPSNRKSCSSWLIMVGILTRKFVGGDIVILKINHSFVNMFLVLK